VDAVQLEQVILNLFRTALDAVESSETRQIRIEVRRQDARTAEVVVSDSGPGVDSASAELIFDEFYTTKPQGLGLGLSISRSIVEAHGGRLWLDRSVHPTACFRLALPLSVPETGDSR